MWNNIHNIKMLLILIILKIKNNGYNFFGTNIINEII